MATHLIQICSLNKHTLFLTLKPQVPDWSIHICIFFRNRPQSSHLAVWQDGVVRRHTYFPKSFLSRLFWISENSQNMHISSFNTVFHCIYPFELWATKTNIKPGTRMLILNIITDFLNMTNPIRQCMCLDCSSLVTKTAHRTHDGISTDNHKHGLKTDQWEATLCHPGYQEIQQKGKTSSSQ